MGAIEHSRGGPLRLRGAPTSKGRSYKIVLRPAAARYSSFSRT